MSGRDSRQGSGNSGRPPVQSRDSQQSSSLAPPGSIRQRSRQACEPCRRRKKKCNGGMPCQACLEYEYDCFYNDAASMASREPSIPPDTLGSSFQQQQLHSQEEQGQRRRSTMSNDTSEYPSVATSLMQTQPSSAAGTASTEHWQAEEETGVLHAALLRYFDASSAIAFPRSVIKSLGSDSPPRLHPIGYNTGMRQERPFRQEKILMQLLSFEEAQGYVNVFFQWIQSYFGDLEGRGKFLEDLRGCWDPDKFEDDSNLMFEVVCCWVIAIGSFYSWPHAFGGETELASRAEATLDRATFQETPSIITLNHARAWIYRTMYRKSTAGPEVTWRTSCVAVQLCESLGLHKEIHTLRIVGAGKPHFEPEELEIRRRLFWNALALNRLISFDYGRSSVFVSGINAKYPSTVDSEETAKFVETAQILYQYSDNPLSMGANQCHLTLYALSSSNRALTPPLAITRSNIAIGLYRRLRVIGAKIPDRCIDIVMQIGQQGLAGTRVCVDRGRPWFTLVSTPFQFICILLSIGDQRALDTVAESLSLLDEIQNKFGTQLAKEAYETARLLVQAASQSRERESLALRNALGQMPQQQMQLPVQPPMQVPLADYPIDFEWDAFFGHGFP